MSLSRRDFCRAGILSAFSIIATNHAASISKTVVVIGAGMAGLSAAIELKSAGFTVVVLEGRDRVGGRVFTDNTLDGLALDLGASWIHGIQGNPIHTLCKKYDLKMVTTDYESITRYAGDGAPLSESRDRRLEKDYASLKSAIARAQEREESDRSLGAFIDDYATKQGFSPERLDDLGYAVNTTIEHEYAADVRDLSLLEFDRGGEFEGPDILFPGGYGQLVDRLKQGLDIRMGHQVTGIEHNQRCVKVTSSGGTFAGDYAVVTLPLGVLKKGGVIFTPALPSSKSRAIDRLGFGVLNKCVLRFPIPFWQSQAHLLGYVSPVHGQWCEWLNIHHYTGEPILLGFNAGSFGKQIESLSDREIVDSAMKVLRTIFKRTILDPTGIRITRWGQDKFAGGSYSHVPPGASGADFDVMAASVEDRLFFAGEATSREHSGTVHGAWLSGQRAASEIKKLAE